MEGNNNVDDIAWMWEMTVGLPLSSGSHLGADDYIRTRVIARRAFQNGLLPYLGPDPTSLSSE